MKKILITLTTAFSLTSCLNEAIEKEQTNNSEITIELLFEKDGCKMYRFYDGGRAIYWSNCEGKTTYSHKEGKHNTIEIQSINSTN